MREGNRSKKKQRGGEERRRKGKRKKRRKRKGKRKRKKKGQACVESQKTASKRREGEGRRRVGCVDRTRWLASRKEGVQCVLCGGAKRSSSRVFILLQPSYQLCELLQWVLFAPSPCSWARFLVQDDARVEDGV